MYSIEIREYYQRGAPGTFVSCRVATLVIQLPVLLSRILKEPFIPSLQSHHGRYDQSDQRDRGRRHRRKRKFQRDHCGQ